jgi:alkylation response protein AidB-like acyl-CoA dehydrogenase
MNLALTTDLQKVRKRRACSRNVNIGGARERDDETAGFTRIANRGFRARSARPLDFAGFGLYQGSCGRRHSRHAKFHQVLDGTNRIQRIVIRRHLLRES